MAPSWISERPIELAAIDPGSTAFRYGTNYDKATKSDVSVPGELWVDLRDLQEVMEVLASVLRRVLAARGRNS